MFANLAEETMLDGIPLGGSGRIMADGDANLIEVHEFFLQGELPSATACSIAASVISQDEQFRSVGVTARAVTAPRLANGFHREIWSVMRGADDDHPAIVS